MLIPLEYLEKKYKMEIKGVLHVGAHECEEIKYYERNVSREKILWIEALSDKVELCKKRYKEILIEEAVISDKKEKVKFNRSNNNESSSLLNLGLHQVHHPQIYYTESIEVETKRLEEILCNYNIDFNFVNLDIQGMELKALKSMESTLCKIDYIYTGVTTTENGAAEIAALEAIASARVSFLQSISGELFKTYGKGWTRRANECLAYCKSL